MRRPYAGPPPAAPSRATRLAARAGGRPVRGRGRAWVAGLAAAVCLPAMVDAQPATPDSARGTAAARPTVAAPAPQPPHKVPPPMPRPAARWRSEADLSASSVGGSPSQALLTSGLTFRREAVAFDARLLARWTYGEATDADDRTAVTRRSWTLGVNVEPKASRASGAFLATSLERSLEQRIDLRTRVEAGVRWGVVRAAPAPVPARSVRPGPAAVPTQLDLTFAAVGERLQARGDVPDALRDRAIPRWSVRARGKRAVADRVTLDHETSYRPVLLEPRRTTLDTRTRIAVRVAEGTDMTLTGQTALDSDARDRGAPVNAVSQVTFGIALRR